MSAGNVNPSSEELLKLLEEKLHSFVVFLEYIKVKY